MSLIDPSIDPNALHFLPLGGAGEIGMNLNLYACRGKWLMVDLGITFGGDTLPGVDVVMPDPAFIEAFRDDLVAIVLTHAHEDHLGAVPYLWRRLRKPIYATPFAMAVLKEKLRDAGLLEQVELHEVPLSGKLEFWPFDVEFVSMTHSIPESNALILRTPHGIVLHTGDWKIDPTPLVGEDIDETTLRAIGEEGVLALVGDSTNAIHEGESGSEAEVRDCLIELIGQCERGVAVTQFASNIARLESVAVAAREHNREVVLVGRALWRYTSAARQSGLLNGDLRLLHEEEGAQLHPENALYLCTGCQGEPRAAMSRISGETHPRIHLEEGDTVIFSSKIIPGNEMAIGRLHNRLAARGIDVITEKDHAVHVSGHPCRGELTRMYQWVKPKIAVPVHGEARHMLAHAELAKTLQVPETVVVTNGDLLRLAPGVPKVVQTVYSGRLALDGDRLISPDHASIRARRRLMNGGVAFVSLVVDEDGHLIAAPNVSGQGIIDTEEDQEEREAVREAVRVAVEACRKRGDETLREAARLAVRRSLLEIFGKRPVIDVQVNRVRN